MIDLRGSTSILTLFRKLLADKSGLSTTEYGVMLAAGAILLFPAVFNMSSSMQSGVDGSKTVYQQQSSDWAWAPPPPPPPPEGGTFDGTEGDDVLVGTAGDDTLNGHGGNDTLQGGGGADTLSGGDGTDYASYENASSGVTASLSDPSINTGDAAGDVYGHAVGRGWINDIEGIIGSAFNDTLYGDANDNTLIGNAGDDQLYGLAGNDMLVGGAGADALDGGDGTDIASYETASAAVTVKLLAPGGNTGDAAGDTYTSIEYILGSAHNDTLWGHEDYGATLNGGAGNDTLRAWYGAGDILIGGAGGDTFIDSSGGQATVSYITATSGVTVDMANMANNTGDAAGDVFSGGAIRKIVGSAHDDTLIGYVLNTGVIFDGGDGNDTLTGTDNYSDTLTGGAGNDTLIGLGGSDTMNGGDGNDLMRIGNSSGNVLAGGDGSDTADFSAVTVLDGGLNVSLDSGLGTVRNDDDILIAQATFSGVENIIGTSVHDQITGSADDNILNGGDGNDSLTGGAGADTLIGGSGDDYANYSDSVASVYVNLSTGVGGGGDAEGDTLSGIENLSGSQFDDTFIGDAGANSFSGGAGNDTMTGGAGADQLYGMDGIDTADYAASGSAVTVNLAAGTGSGGDAEGDTLSLVENVVGSNYNDTLSGDAEANALTGGDGNDTVNGGAGGDALSGGNGTDTLSYAGSSAAVTINLALSTASGGDAQGDTISGFENLIGSANNDSLTGDTNANDISGGAGNDTISAGDGNDTVEGGAGSDSLTGGNGTDTLSYANSASAVTINLGSNSASGGDAQGDTISGFENVTGSGLNDTLTGNTSANTLSGGAGNDTLTADAGNDTLYGGAGNDSMNGGADLDTLYGDDGDDTMDGGSQNDTLYGGNGNDNLFGNTGGDTLEGGAGDDQIRGWTGGDFLYGGDGNDLLVGGTIGDLIDGGAGSDTASYFDAAAGVVASLTNPAGNTGDAAGDSYVSIENLTGSGFDDTLTGDSGANSVFGGGGADTMYGGDGNDTLDAGDGNDIMSDVVVGSFFVGGTGTDTVIIAANSPAFNITQLDTALYQVESVDFRQSGIDVNLAFTFSTISGITDTAAGPSNALTLNINAGDTITPTAPAGGSITSNTVGSTTTYTYWSGAGGTGTVRAVLTVVTS